MRLLAKYIKGKSPIDGHILEYWDDEGNIIEVSKGMGGESRNSVDAVPMCPCGYDILFESE